MEGSTVPVLAVQGPLCRFAPWTAPGRFDGPEGNLSAIFDPEPKRAGGVTRRAEAERRSRDSGLDAPINALLPALARLFGVAGLADSPSGTESQSAGALDPPG